MVASISLFPNGALPKLFPTVSPPSTLLSLPSLPSRSFRAALPKLFLTFPLRPPCRRFHLAPSQRTPQAIFQGCPSVHLVVASISLLPNGTLPKLFPTVSLPFSLSSLPSRYFRTETLPTLFSHGFLSVHPVVASIPLLPYGALPNLFPTISLPSFLSSLPSPSLPSQGSSPQAISHGFPSSPCGRFHLAPSQQLFPTVSPRSTLSLLSFRSFPTELSPSYFRRPTCRRRVFPSVHPVVASILLPPTELSPSISHGFPVRPPCRLFRIAPSQRSSPQAISDGYPPVHPLVASVSLPSRESQLNENPSIRDAFGKKDFVPNGSVMQPIFSGSLSCVCASLRTQTALETLEDILERSI